jgi:hypothetical protein
MGCLWCPGYRMCQHIVPCFSKPPMRTALQAYAQLQAALNLGKRPRRRSPRELSAPLAMHVDPPLLTDARIREIFSKVSECGSSGPSRGTITVEQLRELLEALGVFLDAAQLAESALQLDVARSGFIGVADFVAWMQG